MMLFLGKGFTAAFRHLIAWELYFYIKEKTAFHAQDLLEMYKETTRLW